MNDPYQILGLTRAATAAEIKAAYRKLAKAYHPDLNQGRKDIERKFKDIAAAYDLLGDPAKRARFDRGEIDAQGQPRGFGHGERGGDPFAHGGFRRSAKGFDFGGTGGMDDFLAEFFRSARQNGPGPQEKSADVSYVVTIPFLEACLGGKRRLSLENGKTIDVTIPPGTSSGDKLRLRGLGHAKGAAIIEIQVAPHPLLRREGQALHLEIPISLEEALLGGSATIPTLTGPVTLKIHKGANTGTVMRLKGKGIPSSKGEEPGDMFATLKVMLPQASEQEELASFVEKWTKKHAYNPRKKPHWP